MAKVNNSQKNNKNLKDTQIEQWASGMPFNKWNYILLCISILVLILGMFCCQVAAQMILTNLVKPFLIQGDW